MPGDHAELDWARRAADRLSITSYGTFDRFILAALRQTIGVASLVFHYALTARLAFLSGADVSEVRHSHDVDPHDRSAFGRVV